MVTIVRRLVDTGIRDFNADTRVQAMDFTGDSIQSEIHPSVKREFYWPLWNQELVHCTVVESSRVQVILLS